MQQRQTESAIGQKIGPGSPLQMQWRCTLRTHGSLFSLFQLSVPSSYSQAPLVHKIGPTNMMCRFFLSLLRKNF